jgi:hypothetical protein
MWYYSQGDVENGPVEEAELIRMLRSGSLPPSSLVWQKGMPEWQPASEITALWAEVGNVVQPAPGQPPQVPAGTNAMAITSLVLGIVSFVVGTLLLTAIPGVICGHMARRQIRESASPQAGDGMAITGLVLNYLALLLSVVIVLLIVGFVFFAAKSGVPAPAP